MSTTLPEQRWSLLRRVRAAATTRGEHTAAAVAVSAHPRREAASITLPMLSGVADRLRWVCQQPRTDPALCEELAVTLAQVEDLIQSAWSRAVEDRDVAATDGERTS